MYVIELSNSSGSSPTFGILSAGDAYQSSGTLYTQGCNVNNSLGGLDCSIACQDPSLIFSNPYTLQNCMVLSALAPNVTKYYLGGANLSEGSVEIASKFAINPTNPDFQSLASNTTQTIQGCVEDAQSGTQEGGEYFDAFAPWYTTSDYNINSYPGFPVYNFSCPYEVEPLNADIGGIGVRQGDPPSMVKSLF